MAPHDETHITPLEVVDSIEDSKMIHSQNGDEALGFLEQHADTSDLSEVDDEKLMRRVDWMLMPVMFACYYLQYTDKTLMSYASIMGIIEDTRMPPNGYSHLAIAFYCSFLICEPIQAVLIQKFPTAKYLGVNVVLWGIVLTMNCVATNFATVMALRVLLGVFESVTAPSLIVLTGMWYKRDEQVLRMGYWYQGTSIGPAVSSLVAYGFGKWTDSNPTMHFKSWQVLFLLFGLITITLGVVTFLFLPNNPMSSRLRVEEKLRIIERVRGNQTGIESKRFKWHQFKEVMLDVKTWILSFIVITTNVPNGAVSSFSSIITQNFGYDQYESLLLQLPGAAVSFVSVWFATWWAGKYNGRAIAIIALIIPTLIGGALMAWLPAGNKGGLLTGMWMTFSVGFGTALFQTKLRDRYSVTPANLLLNALGLQYVKSSYARENDADMTTALPLLYSWVTANFAGHTKKVTMNAIVLMSFCIGNVIGPETFQDKDAPQYIPAKVTIVAFMSVGILLTLTLNVLYHLENKKRDRLGVIDMPRNYEFMDLSDKENQNFRYCL